MMERLPNILITGTPGVGKSTLAAQVAEQTEMTHISVSDLAEDNSLYEEYDEERQCHVLDEDRVIDELEDPIKEGGKIIEYHGSSFFPERFFDLVCVLRCDNTVLYDRLKARGYGDDKILENVQCEIMNVLLDEAKESYREDIVREMPCNTTNDMESNVQDVVEWAQHWKQKNQAGDYDVQMDE